MKIKMLFRGLSLGLVLLLLIGCGRQATPEIAPETEDSEIFFYSDQNMLEAGQCTFLRWEVMGDFGAVLDGEEVPNASEIEVCPTETQVFELAIDMGTHVERRSIEIVVSSEAGQVEEDAPEVQPGIPAYMAGSWVSTGGPPGGLGYDIRMDPRNPDVMYVTDAWAGAFKSIDGGVNWFPINNGITARAGLSGDAIPVFSLTIDPNYPDTIWAGTQFGGGVFRSDDAGQSWRSLSNGIQERSLTIRGFTVEPGNSSVVYLAGEVSSWEWNEGIDTPNLGLDKTKGAVYKTTDGGANWQRIWFGDNLARYIWIHPQNHDLLYVSTGIFDREAANSNPETLDPGGVGILRSYDGGNSWEVLGPDNGFKADELYFGSLFMHPENPNILIAAAGNDTYLTALGRHLGAIYLTEDGGDHWNRVLALDNASMVEICTSDPNVMYAGSINGVHRSDNGGHSWTELGSFLWGSEDVLAGFPIDMQCDPRDPMRIFVNNYIGGNFLSEDGGSTWEVSSKGYTGALLRQVDVARNNPAYVYSASRMGMFISSDAGENWVGTAYHPARSPEGIVVSVDRFDENHILAVFDDAGPDPRVTWDSGKSWAVVDTGFWVPDKWDTGSFSKIIFSPIDPNLVLASAGAIDCYKETKKCQLESGHGVLRSADGGETWSQTSLNDAQVFDLKIVDANVAYAAAYPDTVYRSMDSGETWEIVSQGFGSQIPTETGSDPDVVVKPILLSIEVDPNNMDRIFAGFANGGLMTSIDSGETWSISASGLLPEMSIVDIVADPVHAGVFYLGSYDSGVFYSTDSGENWMALNGGLLTRSVFDLALSANGSVLYAATSGGGVFRLGNPGEIVVSDEKTPSETEPVETEPPKPETDQIAVERDLKYGTYSLNGQEQSLLLDLYLPVNSVPVPVLIFLHGGGWFEGSKDDCPGEIFAQNGYATACVNYRLATSPQGCSSDLTFPAQIHDVKAAVRWLRLNADTYGLDLDRFGAIGDSSGGHLAALLGVSSGVEALQGMQNPGASDDVQAVVDWFGPVDIMQGPVVFTEDPCTANWEKLNETYGGEETPYFYWTMAWAYFLGGGLADDATLAQAQQATPLTHIDADDPPFLIIHGEGDGMVPIGQSELLVNALRAANVEATFVRLPGVGHGYFPPEGRQYVMPEFLQETLDFFDQHLKSQP